MLYLQSVLFIHFFSVWLIKFRVNSVCYFWEVDVVMTTVPPFFS